MPALARLRAAAPPDRRAPPPGRVHAIPRQPARTAVCAAASSGEAGADPSALPGRDGSASAAASGRTTMAASRPPPRSLPLPGVLPVLPFPPTEALTPGGAVTLHLYEARYLALLDAALARPDRCFAHAVVGAGPAVWGGVRLTDAGAAAGETGGAVSEWAAGGEGGQAAVPSPARPPPGGPPPLPLGDGRAALRCACLARITAVEPSPGGGPGALVTVRGEARLALTDLVGTAPFLAATAALALDAPPPPGRDAGPALASAGQAVEALMWDAINLTFKLPRTTAIGSGGIGGPSGAASMQAALNWVDHAPGGGGGGGGGGGADPPSDGGGGGPEWRLTPPPPADAAPGSPACVLAAAAERGARLAFAALQEVPHSSPAARAALARARVAALETDDTAARLEAAAAALRSARSALAAKAALHALALG